MTEDDLYQDYVERICIGMTEGGLEEDKAILQARSQVLGDMTLESFPVDSRYKVIGKFKRQAKEEGVIS